MFRPTEVPLRSFYLEWPDPRTSCPGYKYPNGLPITLELGSSVAAKLEAFFGASHREIRNGTRGLWVRRRQLRESRSGAAGSRERNSPRFWNGGCDCAKAPLESRQI